MKKLLRRSDVRNIIIFLFAAFILSLILLYILFTGIKLHLLLVKFIQSFDTTIAVALFAFIFSVTYKKANNKKDYKGLVVLDVALYIAIAHSTQIKDLSENSSYVSGPV